MLRVAAAPAGGRLNVRLTGRTSALVTEPNYRVGAMTVHLVDNVLVTEATYARIEVIVTPRYPTMADAIKSQPDLSRFWVSVVQQLVYGKPRQYRIATYRGRHAAGAGLPARPVGTGASCLSPSVAHPCYPLPCWTSHSHQPPSPATLLSPATQTIVALPVMHATLRPPLSLPARPAVPPCWRS